MLDSGIPSTMWITTTKVAIHVYNRSPHKRNEFKTPLLKICPEKKSHLENIRRFRCIAYVKIPISENKFSEGAIRTILVGYTPTEYILWHPQTNRFINSRHVRCNEKMVYENLNESPEKLEFQITENREDSETPEEKNTDTNQSPEITEVPKLPKPKRGKALKRKGAHKEETEPAHKIRKLPTRESKTNPKRDTEFVYRVKSDNGDKVSELEEDETIFAGLAEINQDPSNYREAIESLEKANWKRVIEEELQSMKENVVWEIVDRPTSTQRNRKPNIIDSKWVFKRKMDENGLEKFKARLVI